MYNVYIRGHYESHGKKTISLSLSFFPREWPAIRPLIEAYIYIVAKIPPGDRHKKTTVYVALSLAEKC